MRTPFIRSLLHRISDGIPNTLLMNGVIACAGLCSGVVLARSLGPGGRGEFATILLWTMALLTFGDLGLGFAFSYYIGKERASLDGVWTMSWLASLVWGFFIATVGALVIPWALHLTPNHRVLMCLGISSVPFGLMTGYQSYLLLGGGFIKQSNIVRTLGTLSYAAGVCSFAVLGLSSIKNYILAYVASQIIVSIVGVGLVKKYLRPQWHFQLSLIKPVMLYGLKSYISTLMAPANLHLDQIIMTVWVSKEQLGIYVVAVSISAMVNPLYGALAVVVLPRVTLAKDLVSAGRQALRHMRIALIAGIPLSVLVIIAMPTILPLLFSHRFVQSVPAAQILMIAAVSQGAVIILGNSLRGLGHPGKTALSEGSGLILTVALLAALLPAYGSLGAAVSCLCSSSLVMILQVVFIMCISNLSWKELFCQECSSCSFNETS